MKPARACPIGDARIMAANRHGKASLLRFRRKSIDRWLARRFMDVTSNDGTSKKKSKEGRMLSLSSKRHCSSDGIVKAIPLGLDGGLWSTERR
jgi:hypothetical protein